MGTIDGKIILGNCLDIYKTIKPNSINLILADPPYQILNKKCNWDKMISIPEMWEMCNYLKRDSHVPIILFAQEPYSSKLIQSNLRDFKYKWYWEKTAPVGHLNAKKQPLRCIEEILVFYEKQPLYNPQKTKGHKPVNSYTKTVKTANNTVVYGETTKEITGGGNTDRYPRNLITVKSDKQTCNLHSTQKPVELLEYLIKTYTNEGDTVFDFCAGSGSTGAACKNTGRQYILIEKDEEYYNKMVQRLTNK